MIIKNTKKLLTIFLIFIYPFFPFIKEHYFLFSNILELLLIIYLFFSSIEYKNKSFYCNKFLMIFSIFYYIFVIFFSNDVYEELSGVRIYLFYIYLFLGLINDIKKNVISVDVIIKTNLLSCSIMIIGALIQFVFPYIIQNIHSIENYTNLRMKTNFIPFSIYNRAISFMLDPNILGVYFTFNYILIKHSTNIKKKKIFYVLLFIAIILTQSRTAIILFVTYNIFNSLDNYYRKKGMTKQQFIKLMILFSVLIFILLFFMDSIINYLRIDTLLSGNGRFEKNIINIDNFMHEDISYILFGGGITSGRDIIFENIVLIFLNTFGIVGTLIHLVLLYNFFKPYYNVDFRCTLFIWILSNLVGDYFIIPQVSYLVILDLIITYYSNLEKRRDGVWW